MFSTKRKKGLVCEEFQIHPEIFSTSAHMEFPGFSRCFQHAVENSVKNLNTPCIFREALPILTIKLLKGALCMIKGVNRKVIEINRTESDYFERAVFYLRPDVNEAPVHAAQLEAQAILGQAPVRRRVSGWVYFLLGAAASGGVYLLLMLLEG